jgi:hypothetical protein
MPLSRRPSWERLEEDIERAVLLLVRVRLVLEERLRWAVTRARAAGGSCAKGGVLVVVLRGIGAELERDRDGDMAGRAWGKGTGMGGTDCYN